MYRITIYIVFFLLSIFSSCTSTKYVDVPVKETSIEYRDRYIIDSIKTLDSTLVFIKGDTIWKTKYIQTYQYRNRSDTILKIDTVPKIVTVEVPVETNKLYKWQIVLMVMGGGLLILVGYKLVKLIRK